MSIALSSRRQVLNCLLKSTNAEGNSLTIPELSDWEEGDAILVIGTTVPASTQPAGECCHPPQSRPEEQ